jgi:hypothetical protein
MTQAKADGEAFAEQYFAAAAAGDTAKVLAMYDAAFYKAAPDWAGTYVRIQAKLGKPLQHTLTSWHMTSTASASGSGTYIALVYQVQYEKAKGTETIGVFSPSDSHKPGIRDHNFNFPSLLP